MEFHDNMLREGVLFAIGNPLLDISAEVSSEFLAKYKLKPNDAILADDSHKDIFKEMIEQFTVDYVPGGATQNSVRIAQWLIGVPNATSYVGCIGRDKFGEILASKVKEAGVNASYMYSDTEPTGTCAVLLTGKHRSLVAYLAAANKFDKSHLAIKSNWALVEKAHYYYMAGFPLTVCPDAMLQVAQHAAVHDKFFAMNLSAPFLSSIFKEPMAKLLPYVDLIIGNETEAAAFSTSFGFGLTDLEKIAIRMARLPKENGKRGRMVIITQGSDPTIVVQEGRISRYPVIHIDPKNIVDTNGAGDAFVGGFLAQLVQGGSIENCIRSANYAANYIIQQSGCTLADTPNFSVTATGGF